MLDIPHEFLASVHCSRQAHMRCSDPWTSFACTASAQGVSHFRTPARIRLC